ncbi:MAG: hydroxyacylglutathione hydrolase [Rhizobiaceae bacterium]|jgi:hydroxyacylglutathione hydrolase|nr:hydroxyacylglutathione hydrolase [Rhizobiaceae bacterium]
MLEFLQFPCRTDNFGMLIHDPASGLTASVDAPEEAPIRAQLAARGWRLTHLFITHHHGDHVEALAPLKAATGCTVIGPAAEADRITGLDVHVKGGFRFLFGNHAVDVIDAAGHTLGQIAYHLPGAKRLFAADCLFSLGCGRIIEGTPEMMFASLERLASLSGETLLHCGHEYTLANGRFALTVDPDNAALQARLAEAERRVATGAATLPVTLAQEKATNPFLRAGDPAIRAHLGMTDADDLAVFTELRRRKDKFKG